MTVQVASDGYLEWTITPPETCELRPRLPMDRQNPFTSDAVIVTDLAGFIRALNADAATLLNVGMSRRPLRALSPFFVEGRSRMLAALQAESTAPLRAGGAVIQPINRRPVAVTVDVTREDDGLQWVLRRATESERESADRAQL